MHAIRIASRRRIGLVAMVLGLLAALIAVTAAFAAGAPVIVSESAGHVNNKTHVSVLGAIINPAGSETKYEFWLLRCGGKSRKCPPPVVVGSGTLPAGNEDQTVEVTAMELPVGSSHSSYWVTATNASGTTTGKSHKLRTGAGKKAHISIPTTATAASGAPVIFSLSASHITEHEATLEAVINPAGSETKYEFWLSWQSTCAHHHPCKGKLNIEVVGTGNLAASDEAQTVSTHLTNLTQHYYRYWVVATNSTGKTQRGEQTFKTKRTKK